MTSKKVIDIANTLELINDYNVVGITGSNLRIAATNHGQLLLYSTTPSSNSSDGALVIFNGGFSINSTASAQSATRGGAMTIAGGVAIAKNIVIGGKADISDVEATTSTLANVLATNVSTGSLIASTLTSSNANLINASISNLTSTTSTIGSALISGGSANLTNASISNLTSTTSTIGSAFISGGSANLTNASISNLASTTSTIGSAFITTSTIANAFINTGTANLTNASISNLRSTSSTIVNALISDGTATSFRVLSGTLGNIFLTGGNVGIGNTAPSSVVDIVGNASVRGQLTIRGTNVSTSSITSFVDNVGSSKLAVGYGNASEQASFAGAAYILSTSGTSLKLIAGNNVERPVLIAASDNSLTVSTTTQSTDVNTGALKVVGGAAISKTLFVGEDINFSGNLYQNGQPFVSGITGGSTQWTDGTGGSISFTTGNVGIGTTSPHATLHVSGGTILDGNATISNLYFDNLSTGTLITNNLNLGMSNQFSGSFTASNNISTPTDVGGLVFPNANVRSFQASVSVSISRSSGGNLYEAFTLEGHQTDAGWTMFTTSMGDTSGVAFTITSSGQVRYTSSNLSNVSLMIFRYYVSQITASGTFASLSNTTQATYLIDSLRLTNTAGATIGGTTGALFVIGGSIFERPSIISSTQNSIGIGSGGALTVLGGAAVSNDLQVGGDLNIVGSLLQNGLPYGSTQWTSGTGGSVFYTSGNVGINTTAPAFTLDVNGVVDATSYTGGGVFATNVTAANIVATSISSGSVVLSGGANLPNNNTLGTLFTVSGNIGINTTSPRSSFEITQTSTTTGVMIHSGVTDVGANNLFFMHHNNTTLWRKLSLASQGVGSNGRAHFGILNRISNDGVNATWADARIFIHGTNGNVGILNTNPAFSLDVNGVINSQSVTTGNISAPQGTLSNLVSTTISSTNLLSTTSTIGQLFSSNITTTNLIATISSVSNATVGTLQATVSTIGQLFMTNAASTNMISTNISTSTLQANNINITSGTLSATFNSNTIGNIFTTGGNVGINNTTPSFSLDVNGVIDAVSYTGGGVFSTNATISNIVTTTLSTGTLNVSTGITTSSIHATNGTISQLFATNASVATLDVSTGITTSSIRATNGTMSQLFATNASVATLDVSTGITTSSMRATNGTISELFATNASIATLDVSTGITTSSIRATNGTMSQLFATNASVATLDVSTGITTSSIRATNGTVSQLFATNLTASSIVGTTTISGATVVATTYTGNSLQVTGVISPSVRLTDVGTLFFRSGGDTNNGMRYIGTGTGTFGNYGVDGPGIYGWDGGLLGSTNGGQRVALVWRNNGNVGIGSTNPSSTLEVGGTFNVTSGGARLTFDSNTIGNLFTTGGNVGLGTASPNAKFHVFTGRTGGFLLMFPASTQASTSIDFTYNTSAFVGTAASARILVNDIGFTANMHLQNRLAGSDNTTMLTRLFISNSGNVGINTTTPAVTLDVSGDISTKGASTNTGYVNLINAVSNTTTTGFVEFRRSDGIRHGYVGFSDATDFKISTDIERDLAFLTNNSQRMVIRATSGNIGINNGSPTFMLDVVGQTRLQSTTGPVLTLSQVASSGFSGFPPLANLYNSGLAINDIATINFGLQNTARNSGYIGFGYVGAGSTSNYIGMGFQSVNNILNVAANRCVGINTTSPTSALHVNGALNFDQALTGQTVGIAWNNGATSRIYDNLHLNLWTDDFLLFQTGGLSTSGNTRMAIDGSGRVGIGTTTPLSALHVVGTSGPLVLQNGTSSRWTVGPDNANAFIVYNAATQGVFLTNGGTGWTGFSDMRIKKNIESLEPCLETIAQLNPVKYNFLQDEDTRPSRVGFIAQEVQQVFPDIVSSIKTDGFPDGLLGLSTTELIPYLVKAIKELKQEFEAFKSNSTPSSNK
jgi:trimeric autotransporter adhesin